MRHHGNEVRGSREVPRSSVNEGRFGRLFRRLPACPAYGQARLAELAKTMLEGGVTPSGWTPAQPLADGDNDEIAAGYTYFGQFVDHDITFDPASSLQKQNDPDALVNFRSPRFDLDSVYGSGPDDEPFQYDRDGLRLRIEPNEHGFEELPRTGDGIAILGDPRNDENSIVSQIQLAFLRLHNRFVEQVVTEGRLADPADQFDEAQRLTRWHYQWVVVNDFLPRLIGKDMFDRLYVQDPDEPADIKLRYYRAKTSAYMPVEFSAAAFRFGHSQIRDRYALNSQIERALFVPGDPADALVDFRGGQVVPASWAISWPFFFPLVAEPPQPSRLINTTLSQSLFDLPGRAQGQAQDLATLNLLRGEALSLPSGQAVAQHMRHRVLTPDELAGNPPVSVPDPTPLWYYLLREAEVVAAGKALGPTGGRIVGEVLLGLLEQDPTSYYNQDRSWRPSQPGTGLDGLFTVGDLLMLSREAP